jgi:drug/metabolite transporter (DMT)-like permease
MPVSVQLGLLCALCCAFVQILGFLYKQRGAASAPPVQWRRPVQSTVALFSNRWWTLGIVVAMGGWGFHVAGLALAPISLVQSVIAGGLAMLTVVADKLFGFKIERREWVGVALTAAGLAILAATLGKTGDSKHAAWTAGTLVAYTGTLTVLAVLCCSAVTDDPPRSGPVLGVAAGLLWGASDVSIKALSGHLDNGALGWIHPLALVILVASLIGLAVSARSLQVGDAVPVIALTSASANLCTIAAGPIVFGEPLPDNPAALALRLAAFLLVIVASALTPPPLRTAEERPLPDPA